MDLGQRAVSCNHAVGFAGSAVMHRVHSVDGPNVRACGVLRDLGLRQILRAGIPVCSGSSQFSSIKIPVRDGFIGRRYLQLGMRRVDAMPFPMGMVPAETARMPSHRPETGL